jgi:cytochrome P450
MTAFGFGRRRCPGLHLADQALYAAIASILAGFEIGPALSLDESGNPVLLPVASETKNRKTKMTGGYIS